MVSKGKLAERNAERNQHRTPQGPVIYVEGGAKGDSAKAARRAFRKLLDQLQIPLSPSVIACGSRQSAYEKFREHLESTSAAPALLLVDAEEVLTSSPWAHVGTRKGDGWKLPSLATDDDLCFMAVVMETWCVADGERVRAWLGLNEPYAAPTDIEQRSKTDIYAMLEKLTEGLWNTKSKARSYDYLEQLSASHLENACPEFRRLAMRIRALAGPAPKSAQD